LKQIHAGFHLHAILILQFSYSCVLLILQIKQALKRTSKDVWRLDFVLPDRQL
jgi:hypothetical protein